MKTKKEILSALEILYVNISKVKINYFSLYFDGSVFLPSVKCLLVFPSVEAVEKAIDIYNQMDAKPEVYIISSLFSGTNIPRSVVSNLIKKFKQGGIKKVNKIKEKNLLSIDEMQNNTTHCILPTSASYFYFLNRHLSKGQIFWKFSFHIVSEDFKKHIRNQDAFFIRNLNKTIDVLRSELVFLSNNTSKLQKELVICSPSALETIEPSGIKSLLSRLASLFR